MIGVPDEKWGEAVKACVQLKSTAEVSEDELIAACKGALGSIKAPKSVDFLDELPRSPVGKVLKRELRAPYWAGRERRSAKTCSDGCTSISSLRPVAPPMREGFDRCVREPARVRGSRSTPNGRPKWQTVCIASPRSSVSAASPGRRRPGLRSDRREERTRVARR